MGTVYSSDCIEELDYVQAIDVLDYMFAFESIVVEAVVLSGDGSIGVGGQKRRDGRKCEEEGKQEECDGDVVTITSNSKLKLECLGLFLCAGGK